MAGHFHVILVTLLAASVFTGKSRANEIIYVNAAATGANDGTSWPNAYLDLQDALNEARLNDPAQCEIWVAAGTYKPDRGTGDVLMVFDLPSGISLYGGFGGWEERLDERNVDLHSTILDGDLLGNDDATAVPTSDCCVSTHEPGCGVQSCVEIVVNIAPFLHDCPEDWDISCAASAVEVCGELCRPTRSDNSYGLVTVFDATVATTLDGFTLRNADGFCNQFDLDCPGIGALTVADSVGLIIRNSQFTENRAKYLQGAAVTVALNSEVTFDRCRFVNNARGYFDEQTVYMKHNPVSDSVFSDCDFIDNDGTALIYSGSGRIERCNFVGNARAALSIHDGAPVVRDCNFVANGDVETVHTGDSTSIVNCRFLGNTGYYALWAKGSDTVVNCIFAGNAGGGIRVSGGSLQLINSVILGNGDVGVLAVDPTYIIDSVIWGNVDPDDKLPTERAQVFRPSGSPQPTLLYNAIEGWTGALGGTGNVGLEPIFVDTEGVDGVLGTMDDDFRLSSDSPLINLGHPNPPLIPYLDADGHARRLCERVDMGAYEFGIGDYNCDRVVEPADFAQFPACLTGPVPEEPYQPDCAAYDFATEINEDVDLLDFAGFQRGFDEP